MGRDLVRDPQGDDAGAFAPQGPCVGIGPVAHLLGSGKDALAGFLGDMGMARKCEGDKLARDSQFFGYLSLCDHDFEGTQGRGADLMQARVFPSGLTGRWLLAVDDNQKKDCLALA